MNKDQYYIISSRFNELHSMMLGNILGLSDEMKDDWMFGFPFTIEPEQLIFVDALIEAGVDNMVPMM